MPRPVSREELLKETYSEREKLEALLKTIPPDVFSTRPVIGEWTSKDVVCHLIAWEQMVILWVKSGFEGHSVPVPADGFKWNELPALNEKIYRDHKDDLAERVLEQFQQSYRQTLDLLNSISEPDLFTPGLHKWQNKNTLAAYFKSCTSSHYLWARKEISKGLKNG